MTAPPFRAEIANLPVSGEYFSKEFPGANGMEYRNHISWRLSGVTVDVYQHPVAFKRQKELEGQTVHTTTAIVRNVRPARYGWAHRLVDDLCALLSFATMSEVRAFQWSTPTGFQRVTPLGRIDGFRPPIEPDGAALRQFVDCTWTRFRVLKRTRSLHELFHYLTLADTESQPLEVRMLLAFVALENMKATYARSKKIPYVAGSYRRVGQPGTSPKGWRRYGFAAILTDMLADVRMRRGLRRIARVRNRIVHNGLTCLPFQQNLEYYEQTRSMQFEYVLRLLGYAGTYFDYATMQARQLPAAT